MELSIDDIVKEYYPLIKDKYPSITKDECTTICKSIFYFIKKHMKSTDFPTIQIKHLGKFAVSPAKIIHLRNENRVLFLTKQISEETFLRRKEGFTFILERMKHKEQESDLIIIDDTEDEVKIQIEDDTPDTDDDEDSIDTDDEDTDTDTDEDTEVEDFQAPLP